MNRKQAITAMIVVILAGVLLRAYRIGDRSLWYDEAFSYTVVHDFSWEDMFHCLQQDVHPPLYFVILRVWVFFWGVSVYSLRGLSVVMGGMTLGIIYLFTKDFVVLAHRYGDSKSGEEEGRAAGVAAATLLAVFSAHISWSQDAKMYSVTTALISLNAWVLVRSLRVENSWKWWATYSITSAAMLYTHNYALFTFAGESVFLLVYFINQSRLPQGSLWDSSNCRAGCLATIGTACLYLPWVPTLLEQSKRVKADYWIGRTSTADFWMIPYALDGLFFPRFGPDGRMFRAVAITSMIVAIMFWLVLQRRMLNWLLILLVLTPMLSALFISLTFASIVTPRYLLFAALFLPSAVVGIVWSALPRIRWKIVSLLAVNLLVVHVEFLQHLKFDSKGTEGIVNYVLKRRLPNQPVIVTNSGIFFTVKYYAGETLNPKLLTTRPLPHYLGGPILKDLDKVKFGELLSDDHDTVWVIGSTCFSSFPGVSSTLPASWLPVSESRAEYREVFNYQGVVTAELYRRSQ